jgi:outer membrane protein assembly factor BamA
VLTGIWSYRWYRHHFKALHRIDLIDLNYVFMPWISDTFKRDYLENESTQNSILRYNYQDLFIMKLGYTYTYNSMGNTATSTYGKNAYAFRFNIETAGNVLYAFSHLLNQKKNDQKAFTLFNIAYAEYVKGDFDYSKSFVLDQRNSVACHVGLGIAYPYGNSSILPYEKRYFSGGANSVRGWSVRSLGPGTYSGGNGRIDFINQTGDIKLDLNAEYRTYLFWKLNGALFVDAGNIWTIRKYADQPGGQFSFNTFWKQIAVSYGLGLRFNFDYFILRLDGGMRAVNPAYTTNKEHYPIIYPHFGRDFAFHFAVGLPF